MLTLFPRYPACEWCGASHAQTSLCQARPGVTRRSFLFLSGAAAVAAIVAPSLPAAYKPTTITEIMLTAARPITYKPGAFVVAMSKEMDALIRDVLELGRAA